MPSTPEHILLAGGPLVSSHWSAACTMPILATELQVNIRLFAVSTFSRRPLLLDKAGVRACPASKNLSGPYQCEDSVLPASQCVSDAHWQSGK